jgi:tol-pal system protein YbgF
MVTLLFLLLASPEDLYKDAKKSFDAGKFEVANKQFERFLLTYPDDKLFPSALYWAGKLKENPAKACEYYNKIINNYPDNEYAPYALYGLAQYEEIKGNCTSADEMYRKIMTNYPDSKCANLMKDKIVNVMNIVKVNVVDSYFIQVGAFSDSSRAVIAQRGLSNYTTFIISDKNFFKLKIGIFASPDSAKQFMLKNNIKGFITKY